MKWQKRARVGVALFGLVSAIVVYAAMGERAKPAPAVATNRTDPKAVIESQGNILQQVRGTRQDYLVEADRQLVYEGGATKLVGVKVTIRNRSGRDFQITAHEAIASNKQEELHLSGTVRLAASDGFEILTPEAFFTQGDGNVRAPQAFSFKRGLMSGTGTGMTYNRDDDVLPEAERFDITRADNEHIAFGGGGPHFCLGANLARAEIRILFDTIANRMPDIAQTGEPRMLRSAFINGIKELPVRYSP